jgi:hypothetical protein
VQQLPDIPVTKLLPSRTKYRPSAVSGGKARSLSDLRPDIENVTKVKDLSPEQQNVFNFLKLVVDIKYRHEYGRKIEQDNGKGYSTYDD